MCSLLTFSCPLPSSLCLKRWSSLRFGGLDATVPIQPIFSIAGAYASSGFSYCLGYLKDNLVSIIDTAADAYSLVA